MISKKAAPTQHFQKLAQRLLSFALSEPNVAAWIRGKEKIILLQYCDKAYHNTRIADKTARARPPI